VFYPTIARFFPYIFTHTHTHTHTQYSIQALFVAYNPSPQSTSPPSHRGGTKPLRAVDWFPSGHVTTTSCNTAFTQCLSKFSETGPRRDSGPECILSFLCLYMYPGYRRTSHAESHVVSTAYRIITSKSKTTIYPEILHIPRVIRTFLTNPIFFSTIFWFFYYFFSIVFPFFSVVLFPLHHLDVSHTSLCPPRRFIKALFRHGSCSG
jgi:hypothetical protein